MAKRRVILRYALFQIPGFALLLFILLLIQRWFGLPTWFFYGALVLWIVKEIVLFPFVWRAYDRDRLKELHSLVGMEGIVEERLAPSGYIRVHGELWQAEIIREGPPIEKGEVVRIQGIRGLVLLVYPRQRQNI